MGDDQRDDQRFNFASHVHCPNNLLTFWVGLTVAAGSAVAVGLAGGFPVFE